MQPKPSFLRAILDRKIWLSNILRTHQRHVTGWKNRIKQQQEAEKTVYQYAGKNTKRKNRIYTWGYAATGALGVHTFLRPSTGFRTRHNIKYPFRFKFFEDNQLQVYNIACGYGYTVYACMSPEGYSLLYGTGINTDSQIGYHEYPYNSGRILDYLIEPTPIQLPGENIAEAKITHLACGRAHTIVVTDKGQVFSLGNNSAGQCGRNIVQDEVYSHSQQINRLTFDKPLKQVVCGQDHTLFVTRNGQVYSCGLGADGQTGQGDFGISGEIRQVKGDIENENIVQISSKADCILAVSDSGEIFGWGNSEYNQLACVAGELTQVNIPKHLPFKNVGKVKTVAAAGSMCLLLNDSGDVYVWGYGLLGKGPKLESTPLPSQIPGTVLGRNQFNPDSYVVDIQCGMNYFTALTDKGDLYTWGRNKSGTLGLGNELDQFFPFKVNVPAEVTQVYCGVDHMAVLAKTFS